MRTDSYFNTDIFPDFSYIGKKYVPCMFLKITGKKRKALADEELAALFKQSGDMNLLGELYGRHMEMVFAVCFKYLKDEDASKDAVMQLFEKLSIDLQRHQVSNFKGWLHQVARNHCLMQLRSAQNKFRDNMVPIENERAEGMKNEPFLHPRSEALEMKLTQMEDGLGKLPPEQEQCVRLFYLERSEEHTSDSSH